MLPVIALIGRPNVGKSTLFNALTGTRNALVADLPGLTRDYQYGHGKIGPRPYLVVDTGGLTEDDTGIAPLVAQQAWRMAQEADALLFLVDAKEGLTALDETLAHALRRLGKPLYLAVNKAERRDPNLIRAEFYTLGLGEPYAISAAHKQGLEELLEVVLATWPVAQEAAIEHADSDSKTHDHSYTTDDSELLPTGSEEAVCIEATSIHLAIVGRPNVGKSTFINRLLGEERMLTFDMPGTTRDSIAIPFEKDGQAYTLIDTAGIRRRSRVTETIEKFSVIKALQAVESAHVAVLMIDARQGIGDQDATLLGYIVERGRALVIAVNKWDHLPTDVRDQVKCDLERKLAFVDFAKIHFISALHGSGIMEVLESVKCAYAAACMKLATPELTRLLQQAMIKHQPPLVHGHSIKLRYAHQGGQNPPVIVIHGNRINHIPNSYRRYLEKFYRQQLNLWGTPVRLVFKSSDNPYHAKG